MVARRHPKKHQGEPLTKGEANRVLDVLDRMDAARKHLDDARADLVVVVHREKHERVRKAFEAFQREGGASGDDWLAFLNGESLRGCTAVAELAGPDRGFAQRHIRLIVDNARNTRRRRVRTNRTGPTAA